MSVIYKTDLELRLHIALLGEGREIGKELIYQMAKQASISRPEADLVLEKMQQGKKTLRKLCQSYGAATHVDLGLPVL